MTLAIEKTERMHGIDKWPEVKDRARVRNFRSGWLSGLFLRFCSNEKLQQVYEQVMEVARGEYSTPAMGGIAIDFDYVAQGTCRVEREVVRRGMDRLVLNTCDPDHEQNPKYATELWKNAGKPDPHFRPVLQLYEE